MKFGILGDLHLTSRGPRRRLDDYFETQLRKFEEALDIFEQEGCTQIIQVGDFFESPDVSNSVIAKIISILRVREIIILCCYGQHDISGHSAYTLRRSPLKVLESAGVIQIVSDEPIELINKSCSNNDDKRYAEVYAASFGREVPKTCPDDPYNILITHRMIGDRPLYPDQELKSPRKFLKDYPDYNLVLCGDYHYRFIDHVNGRTIINPGCIVRKSINLFDLEHKPAVVTFDVNINEVKVHELAVASIEEVFDLTRDEKKDNKSLLQFIENLKKENAGGVNWKQVLVKVFEERGTSKEVKALIDQEMDKQIESY